MPSAVSENGRSGEMLSALEDLADDVGELVQVLGDLVSRLGPVLARMLEYVDPSDARPELSTTNSYDEGLLQDLSYDSTDSETTEVVEGTPQH